MTDYERGFKAGVEAAFLVISTQTIDSRFLDTVNAMVARVRALAAPREDGHAPATTTSIFTTPEWKPDGPGRFEDDVWVPAAPNREATPSPAAAPRCPPHDFSDGDGICIKCGGPDRKCTDDAPCNRGFMSWPHSPKCHTDWMGTDDGTGSGKQGGGT